MTTQSGARPAIAAPPTAALLDALTALRGVATQLRFALPVAGAARAIEARTELVKQLDDYLLPRLRRLDAPLLVVVGGSTGVGKSTMVNSLVRAPVSAAGVLRPTTRSPVLVCHPYDLHWFSDSRVLPELTRTGGASGDHRIMQLVSSSAMTPGTAFLDAPDIDSVVSENRRLAGQLLAAADLWLFVTTAARYADAVPWDTLQAAQARGTALAVLLDRVPPGAEGEVRRHLQEMLAAHRLGAAPLFVVPEVTLADGLLPERAVAPLRAWCDRLAGDAAQRAAIVRHTLDGALGSLRRRVAALAAQAAAQVDAAQRLREEAGAAYDAALGAVERAVRDGSLLRGEALARWREFAGADRAGLTLPARIGHWRDRLASAVTGAAPPGSELAAALATQLVLLVDTAAERAAEQTAAAWRADPAGTGLLPDGAGPPAHSSGGFRAAAERAVRDWQAGVRELVHRAGGSRRAAAYGITLPGLQAMVMTVAATGAGTGPLAGLLGESAAHRLAETTRNDLLERVAQLLDEERTRFDKLLAAHAPDPDAAARLDSAVTAVDRAR